jgi:transposase InsO family protein
MSRQNYYKQRKVRQRRKVDEDLVAELVKRERRLLPRLGVRKLHSILSEELLEVGCAVGRDRFFEILRERHLLLEPLPRGPQTTNSRHSLPVYRNLIKNIEPSGPNQIWVSDITYIRTDVGFEYLALIMDLYSRKIVGLSCGDDLSANGPLKALNQALADLPEGCKPIHHSDRGSQYCSHAYAKWAEAHGLSMSMTEENHCAENSHAERLNGILKQEHGLGMTFRTKAQARAAARQAATLYNNYRPHTSLNLRKPVEVHREAA